MIPINIKKLLHRRSLIAAMAQAKADTPVAAWLLPQRQRRLAKAGETLWHKGEVATEMVCVETGQVRLKEPDVALGAGALLGEIGLFSPDHHRTGTSACDTDCVRHTRSAAGRAQLYDVHPKPGFHLMRLVVARLLHDIAAAKARAAEPMAATN